MALYSVDIMHRLLTGALNGPWSTNYTNFDIFRYRADSAGHAYNQTHMDITANSASETGGQVACITRDTPRLYRSFDPATEPASMDPLESQFEVRDARLYVRFNGWFTIAELDEFWTSKSDTALYYTMLYGVDHFTQIKAHVAVRRASDPDMPKYWRGAVQPDIQIVYDHTQPVNTRVFGDLLLDITDCVCDCPRYREGVAAWKERFPVALPKVPNVARKATVSSPSSVQTGNVTALINGTVETGTTKPWAPYLDGDLEVKVQFDFAETRTIKQVRIYGWGADSDTKSVYFAPYHWRVEGSHDGTAWDKVPVLTAVRNAELYNTDEVETPAKSDTNPTVVNISTAVAYRYYRIVLTDYYGGGGWNTLPLREIELYDAAHIV